MSKILTEISAGELLDKIRILEIKIAKIKDQILLDQVKKEYQILSDTKNKKIKFSKEVEKLFNDLKKLNEKLWIIEDEIRMCESNSDFKDKFIQLARDVYFNNDKRSKIKSKINEALGSNIKEVKKYASY